MSYNTVKRKGKSNFVNMGPIRLRQPLPSANINMIDPFILLHHYGPYYIDDEHNPFDLGPHPHRGFEPVTFLIQGEQLHRDSLGNKSVVKAGDVQWTTAGRGIIHAEGPTKDFVHRGGTLEGIQLWINLPSEKKMIAPNYQHIKTKDFNTLIADDEKVSIQIIAGKLDELKGKIETQTMVNAFMIDMDENSAYQIKLTNHHQSLLYLIKGSVLINDTDLLEYEKDQLIEFNGDGDGIMLNANRESKLLFLSGKPINEAVASWGPYVMNTQTEILEALRDYQSGKMGFLEP